MKLFTRLMATGVACAGSLMVIGTVPVAAANINCSDFTTQPEAQAWLLAHDPARALEDLDRDSDGKACEDLPPGPMTPSTSSLKPSSTTPSTPVPPSMAGPMHHDPMHCLQMRHDPMRCGQMPVGGVQAGGGGTARGEEAEMVPIALGLGGVALLGGGVALRQRRRGHR
ncbi:excalibur calcium-binding domain-containing protein [Frankia sp. Mgl5]|uniref:excalibur calcium-binding domain-containing protein n=1 Tax=Frankia sp. Mgl5 TaxID=2933793 RepID=UPI00201043E8|nr:excalibur calcium-binding domain-containing protein [Frankia sp. Mgl5]MCK9929932.1 excalibur calcium-binding domain-containing protein [Frankia sp. Mgl5]